MNIDCFSSLNEVDHETLLTQDQILVINKVNDRFHIDNYKLNLNFKDYAYRLRLVGSYYSNDQLSVKNTNVGYVKIDNELVKTTLLNQTQTFKYELGFNKRLLRKSVVCDLCFNIEDDIFVKLIIRFSHEKNLDLKKSIILYDSSKNYHVLIDSEENLDKIFNHFLSMCKLADKKQFDEVLSIANYTIKDYINDKKENNDEMYKKIKNFFVKDNKIVAKRTLDKLLNMSFKLNDNTIGYFPFIKHFNNVDFTFLDNDGNIIEDYQIVDEEEEHVLKHLKSYYLNGYGAYHCVLDPFTKKFNKRTYYIGYESATGLIIFGNRSKYPYAKYLNYNGIYYESNVSKKINILNEEYDMLKKLTS